MKPYGYRWRTRIRPAILARDGRRCKRCGRPWRLQIAHLDGDNRNDSPANLAALCTACHRKHDHPQWAERCRATRSARKDRLRPLLASLLLLITGCAHKPAATELGTAWEQPPAPYQAALNTIAPMPANCQPVKKPYSSENMYGGVICSNQCSGPNLQAGERWTDPYFGATMTALTGQNGATIHGYSLPSAHSSSNRWVNVTHGSHQNLDLFASPFKPYGVPSDGNSVLWDQKTDDTYYYISGTRIMARSMRYFADATIYDFAGTLSSVQTGGSTHISEDYLAVWGAQEHQVCALNLLKQRKLCADYLAPHEDSKVGYEFIDFVMVTPRDASLRQYVVLAASPAIAVFAINEAAGVLDYVGRGPERTSANGFNDPVGNQDGICDPGEPCLVAYHMDATVLNGRAYLFLSADLESPCERQLMLLPLIPLNRAWADKRSLLPIALCSSEYEWPEMHFGCAYKTGACVASTATAAPAPYGNQVLLLRDETHITRLNYSYSKKGTSDTYWWYPRASISNDGRYIVFDSTVGRPDTGDGFSGEQVFQVGPFAPMPASRRTQ